MAVRGEELPLWLVTTVPTERPGSSSVKLTASPAANPRSAIPHGTPASTASGASMLLGCTPMDARDLAPVDNPSPSIVFGFNEAASTENVTVPLPLPFTATVPTDVELLFVLK